ncbi:LysR family transcriptional regulator [Psychromarinibacter sp. C21-152]|uniref:HTH-type transcriptional regulator CbbR n=1 Tax=Psychromarinibacter sediminicola TaxID=3033385 RepID=A0AAE3NU31_9RHOB|nr:LysR family transcriptional regulator [Psychromarinibacter sediminicola]MDF0601679.1 LysR family transcriptional regulator [Psychromarinibacter sediminicola]
MKRIGQITLKQLRALKAVVTESTISAAAERLHLTGPAVHNQLKTLEDSIGSPLLQRSGAERNTPTPQGRALLAAHDEIQAALERAIGRIRALDSGHSGRVVLGVVSTGKYFAPRIVALLQKEMPELEVALRVGNRTETIEALARGEFDLCIMGRPPREPMVDAIPLVEHPHVLIAAADHPLAALDEVPRAALLGERFVMREEGSGTRILATRFLDEIGEGRIVPMVEMTSNETIKQAVLNGLGIAIISAHTVADELQSGRLVALRSEGLPLVRHWYVLSRSDQRLSAAAVEVRDWIVAHVEEIFPKLGAA